MNKSKSIGRKVPELCIWLVPPVWHIFFHGTHLDYKLKQFSFEPLSVDPSSNKQKYTHGLKISWFNRWISAPILFDNFFLFTENFSNSCLLLSRFVCLRVGLGLQDSTVEFDVFFLRI